MPEQIFEHILKVAVALLIMTAMPFTAMARTTGVDSLEQKDAFRIMFYNLENLFDTYNDPLTRDDEFTPKGAKRWSEYRYRKKLLDISKVMLALGEWNPPDVIGLCEVENFQVLLDLVTKTPLKSLNYQIVHENSRDQRGIDVALLYNPAHMKKIAHKPIRISDKAGWETRDILLSEMVLGAKDTIHFFVNHWPSRFGGKEQSEHKRLIAAKTLRYYVDSIAAIDQRSGIIIMGDFNDEAGDKSIREELDAKPIDRSVVDNKIYNLTYPDYRAGLGTLVFKEIENTWFLFDQMMVSGSLLNGKGLEVKNHRSMIFSQPWLLLSGKPFRTYQGPAYKGGFSDHLPIFIDLYYSQ